MSSIVYSPIPESRNIPLPGLPNKYKFHRKSQQGLT